MTTSRRVKKQHKRKQRRKRVLFFLVLPVLTLLIGATAYGINLVNKAASAVEKSYEPVDRDKTVVVNPKKDNISILILGVDDSDVRGFKEGSRTDAMILATLNQQEKSVKMLSIPRDSYVYIPDSDTRSRINHAHSWGGVPSTIKTVETLFDIDINYYVKMNFKAFIEVVDSLDGIEIEVPYSFYELDSNDNYNAIHLQAGLQTLNGEQTLALARTRKLDNDFERGKRQQEIVKAIVKKALTASSITKYGDVIDALGDNMTLNMTFSEMTSFFNYAAAGSNLQVDTLNLVGKDMYINGAYYFDIDDDSLAETKQILKEHLSREKKTKTDDNNDPVN